MTERATTQVQERERLPAAEPARGVVTWQGVVVSINIAPAARAPLVAVEEVRAGGWRATATSPGRARTRRCRGPAAR